MKSINLFFFSALVLMACNNGTQNQTENKQEDTVQKKSPEFISINRAIDQKTSTIKWKGEMLGMYAHEGTLDIREGYITEEKGVLVAGGFVVDMRTMVPTDDNFMPEEGKTPDKLVAHLSSEEFFDVKNHPLAMFDIIEMGEGMLKGNLTIRANKNEETVENVEITRDGDVVRLTGTMTFDRKKYEVAFDHPVKEMVLSDDITVQIELITKK